jgi:sec-independent protein translocase protein TatA
MGTLSVWHWLIVLAIVLIFFGGSGKISGIMGDFAKGIKSFKKGMAEDEAEAHKPDAPKTIETGKPVDSQSGVGSKVV